MANRVFVRNVLSDAQWRVIEAVNGEETLALATASIPDLILMDIGMPRGDGMQTTSAIRASAPPLASVAILAFTSMRLDDAELLAIGMDGRVPKPCSPDMLVATVERWRPAGETDGARRLAEVFGLAELVPLVLDFRAQLHRAVLGLDAGDVTAAHRIAGIAGTLGFAAVSESWLALSHGDLGALDQARRDARIAILQIDRDSVSPCISRHLP